MGDGTRGEPAFSSRYVGRAKEIGLFTESLKDRRKIVVGISGDDGFGKSTLLATFEQIALEADVVTALATETGEGVPALLGRLAERLARHGAQLGAFDARYRTYRQRLNQLEADPQAPKGLAVLAAGTVARGGLAAGRLLPGSVLAWPSSRRTPSRAEPRSSRATCSKVGNKDEVKLVLNPVEELSTVFLQDMRKLAPRRVALFVDADDASCRDVQAWLLGVVQEDYGDVPDGLLLAVASPRELDRADWVELEPQVTRVSVGPLSDDEARAFLAQAGIANDAVVSEIVRRSGGVPLALAVLAAERPESPRAGGRPERHRRRRLSVVGERAGEAAARRRRVDSATPEPRRSLRAPRADRRPRRLRLAQRASVRQGRARGMALQRAGPRPDAAPVASRRSRELDAAARQARRVLREARAGRGRAWRGPRMAGARARARVPQAVQRASTRRWSGSERIHVRVRVGSSLRPPIRGDAPPGGHRHRPDRVRALGDTLVAGTAAIDADDNEKAREMFTTLLGEGELDGMWRAKASDWRGYLAALDGRLDEALPDFDTAVELEPDSAEYRIDRGRTLARSGRYEDALADLDRAIALDPENSVAFVVRAETHQVAGRLDKAAADVARAVELQPKNTVAWLLQADVLQLTGKTEEALASADRAVEIEPENAQAWVVHARIQQALGRTDAALSDLDRAVSLAPDDVGMLALRANMHVRAGDLARAREDLESAVARSAEFSTGEAGEILAAIAPEEVDRRMAMAASLSGIDGREAARQFRAYRDGPDAVKRVLEADLATIEALIHMQAGDVDAAFAELQPRDRAGSRTVAGLGHARTARAHARPTRRGARRRAAGERARAGGLPARCPSSRDPSTAGRPRRTGRDRARAGRARRSARRSARRPAASGVSSLQGSIPGTLGADLAAAQELTALAVADRDSAIRVFRSEAAASEALYFESIPDHDRAVGALTRSIELTESSPKPELFMRRGEALRLAGRLDEAVADLIEHSSSPRIGTRAR